MKEILAKKELKYFGIYRGKVLDTQDPDYLGRIKVQVYPVFAAITDPDGLPWAVPAMPISQGAGLIVPSVPLSGGIGSFVVPQVDTFVFVFFEEGDHYQPVYFAEASTAKWGMSPDRIANVLAPIKATVSEPSVPIANGGAWIEQYDVFPVPLYPENKVIRMRSGIVLEIDETPAQTKIKIFHPSLSWVEIMNNGDFHIHLAGDSQEVVKENKNVYIKGSCNITADGNINVKSGATVNVQIAASEVVNVGSNITVTAGGTIIIQGALVHINP